MATVQRQSGVQRWLWTKRDYHRLGELGFFTGKRVELIEGKLMVFSPQNAAHSNSVVRVLGVLQAAFGPTYIIRPQLPIDLGQTTEPEPDLAVVVGPLSQFNTNHPTTAVLIVEISDSTLAYDRRRKGSLYARAGIADYWIVNLVRRQVEIYRTPIPAPNRPYGHRYSSRTDLQVGSSVAPLALPAATIPVADLLP